MLFLIIRTFQYTNLISRMLVRLIETLLYRCIATVKTPKSYLQV